MIYQNNYWYDIFVAAFQIVWEKLFLALPGIFVAIILFVVGWVIAIYVGKIIKGVVDVTKIDNVLAKLKVDQVVSKWGMRLDAGRFVGELVRWFLVIVFLLMASEVVGLTAVSQFLNNILLYIPSVIMAAIILLIAAFVANFLQKVVATSAGAAKLVAANFAATVVKWSILIVGFLIAMDQLGITQGYLMTLYTGVVAMLAIAGGLAFGLGGKEQASVFLAKLSEEIKERR